MEHTIVKIRQMLVEARRGGDFGSRYAAVTKRVTAIITAIKAFEDGLKNHRKLVEIFEVPGTSGSDASSVSALRSRARSRIKALKKKLAPLIIEQDKLKDAWDVVRDKTGEEH